MVSFSVHFSLLLLVAAAATSSAAPVFHRPSAIFGFTDSLSDTGNRALEDPTHVSANHLPYGMSLGRPTGRFCDGYVTIDYLAQMLNLGTQVPPSLSCNNTSFMGRNFGYAGATVFLAQSPLASPHIFSRQVQDFLFHQALVQGNKAANALKFNQALYFVQIGGDDFNFGFQSDSLSVFVNKTLPAVVDGLRSSIMSLHAAGARTFLVLNMPAAGCTPVYLSTLTSLGSIELDAYGCLSGVNELVQVFNRLIHEMLIDLNSQHEGTFIYYDWFATNMDLLRNADSYGFSKASSACCGTGGGKYNCADSARICGCTELTVPCENPSAYLSFDGVHQTDHFYYLTALDIVSGKNLDPPVRFLPYPLN